MLLVMLIPRNVEEMEFASAYMIAGHVGGAILVSLHSRSSLPAQLLRKACRSCAAGGRRWIRRSAMSTQTTGAGPRSRLSI